MDCERCGSKMIFIFQSSAFPRESLMFSQTKDFYCTNCKCSKTERYVNGEMRSVDWVDFNG